MVNIKLYIKHKLGEHLAQWLQCSLGCLPIPYQHDPRERVGEKDGVGGASWRRSQLVARAVFRTGCLLAKSFVRKHGLGPIPVLHSGTGWD